MNGEYTNCIPFSSSPAGLSLTELVQAVQVLLGQGLVAQEAHYQEWLAGSQASMTPGDAHCAKIFSVT